MAGIAGIFFKKRTEKSAVYRRILISMLKNLAVSDSQKIHSFISEKILFGRTVIITDDPSNYFQQNKELGISFAVDGTVYVDETEKRILTSKFGIQPGWRNTDLIPYLYEYYGKTFTEHITGWYNLVLYDKKSGITLLVNDRLGYLPLYYFETDHYFLFASKLDALLGHKLSPNIDFDNVTIAEHLLFNYPLSDATFIKGVRTLSNAVKIEFKDNCIHKETYWTFSDLISTDQKGGGEGFELFDEGLRDSIHKIIDTTGRSLNMSLTGGWDSRVVLSYLLPEKKDFLNLYSFGAKTSDDIQAPIQISEKENLNFTPYVLHDHYIQNHFFRNAEDTISLSGGLRNLKRAHYLYTIKKISKNSPHLLSGIFGDEVFKMAEASGGAVISKNTVALLESDFDIPATMNSLKESVIFDMLHDDKSYLLNVLEKRLLELKESFDKYNSITEKYYAFRFEVNLRKYFGHEVSSYNDFVQCTSPFIDIDFLEKFVQTEYFNVQQEFNSNSLFLKRKSSMLYHDIIQKNYAPLLKYPSSRGYAIKDVNSLTGNMNILYQIFSKRFRKPVDGFNTNSTVELFKEKYGDNAHRYFQLKDQSLTKEQQSNIYSLGYWMDHIQNKFGNTSG